MCPAAPGEVSEIGAASLVALKQTECIDGMQQESICLCGISHVAITVAWRGRGMIFGQTSHDSPPPMRESEAITSS
jgi:hypothetical protein